MTTDGPLDPLGSTQAQFVALARDRVGRGAGVAGRLWRAALHGRFAPEEHGLGERPANAFRAAFRCTQLAVVRTAAEPHRVADSVVRTEKAVLAAADGRTIETVRIPIGTRREAQCVSSQIGCAMACRFCETARMGLVRDLTAGEIVGQVVTARSVLGWRPRTLVFQGMGEALDNWHATLQAIAVLTDPGGFGYAAERITICTAGHVDGLRRLARTPLRRLGLALSLNAVDDDLRARLMPIARRWPLSEVQRALAEHGGRRNRMLMVHWCLLPGINDGPDQAAGIARFCAPLGRVMVHVIPYNPGSFPITRAPSDAEVGAFVERLRGHGLAVRRRITKGRDLMAACGQLGTPRGRGPGPRGAYHPAPVGERSCRPAPPGTADPSFP